MKQYARATGKPQRGRWVSLPLHQQNISWWDGSNNRNCGDHNEIGVDINIEPQALSWNYWKAAKGENIVTKCIYWQIMRALKMENWKWHSHNVAKFGLSRRGTGPKVQWHSPTRSTETRQTDICCIPLSLWEQFVQAHQVCTSMIRLQELLMT